MDRNSGYPGEIKVDGVSYGLVDTEETEGPEGIFEVILTYRGPIGGENHVKENL